MIISLRVGVRPCLRAWVCVCACVCVYQLGYLINGLV